MSRVESDGGRAKVKGQDDIIDWGSSLAVIGIFVEVIRARFRGENAEGLPWKWEEDPRPGVDDTGEPGEGARNIAIESDLIDDPEARNFRPAVFVGVEDCQYNKVVVGDRYGRQIPDRLDAYYAQTTNPITIHVVSSRRGESAVLGDIIFKHILCAKNLIRETFTLHALEGFVKGKTQPYRRSAEVTDSWTTPLSFVATIEERWLTRPVAPLLQEIRFNFAAAGDGNAVRGATSVALYSKRSR